MAGSNVFFDNRFHESQTFTSSGTFTVPAGVDMVFVEMYGGGGSGCRVTSAGSGYAIFGGESGERVHAHIPVTPGANISVSIGSGGAAIPSGGSDVIGNDGTATTFGSYKSRGGLGGGYFVDGVAFNSDVFFKGMGRGQDSFRATGGNNSGFVYGGDAGYGNGGNGAVGGNGGNGGLGAGGGSALASLVTSGAGGDGICIVFWKKTI